MSERRIATAMNMAVRQRNYRRARDRALVRLAKAYPELYQEYLLEEKVTDERMGKSWLDITGSTIASDLDPRANSTVIIPPTPHNRENPSNTGGEA